jgi:hypothetical protein
MRLLSITITFLVFFALTQCAASQPMNNNKCSKKNAISAEMEAGNIKDWIALYESFKNFTNCDDGAIAEGYSNSVGYLLSNEWNNIVLRHIDDTISIAVIERIAENLNLRCPQNIEQICDLIKNRVSLLRN